MNLALPALLLFLLVLPGVIARYTYARGTWRWSSVTSIGSIADEVAYSLVLTSVLHLTWGGLVTLLGHPVDVVTVAVLLTGSSSGQDAFRVALAESVGSIPRASAYFLTLYAFSAIIGALSHATVRYFEVDLKFPAIRFRNPWFYLLNGDVLRFREQPKPNVKPAFVYLSTVVVHGGTEYLYRGVVAEWALTSKGDLDWVVLRLAHRRLLSRDRSDDQERRVDHDAYRDDPRYYNIEGDYLLVRSRGMKTVNLEYIILEELEDSISESAPADRLTVIGEADGVRETAQRFG